MKKLATIFLLSIILISLFFTGLGFINPRISVKYNGTDIYFSDIEPTVYDGGKNFRIIAPVDLLAVKMGASVRFDNRENTVTIKKGADTITFYNEKNIAMVNGREKKLAVEAKIEDGHIYASANFLGDNMGKLTYWESKTSSINIVDIENKTLNFNESAKEYISIENFLVNSERIVFKKASGGKSLETYPLDEKLNPNVNRQYYNMIRSLADQSYYLGVGYNWMEENNTFESLPSAYIAIAPSKSEAIARRYNLSFAFFDKTPANPKKIWNQKNFSSRSVIKLEIYRLLEAGNRKNIWIDDFYENKLKLALIALFQESTGVNIYDYLSAEYKKIKKSTDEKYINFRKSRRFDNLKVDLVRTEDQNGTDCINVYFSYQ